MAWDVLSLVVGLVVGGLAVGIAVEAMGRGRTPERQTTKLTSGWRLAELHAPTVVARDVLDVQVPAGAKVYASGLVDPAVLQAAQVRNVPPVRAEFAVDQAGQKALLFLGGLRPGTLAVLTVDRDLVGRLATEARMLQDRGAAYVERHRIGELVGREGAVVETQGQVADVLPFRDRFMIRLTEGDATIGVLVDKDPDALREERILVKGTLARDRTGYPVIEASEIRRLQ